MNNAWITCDLHVLFMCNFWILRHILMSIFHVILWYSHMYFYVTSYSHVYCMGNVIFKYSHTWLTRKPHVKHYSRIRRVELLCNWLTCWEINHISVPVFYQHEHHMKITCKSHVETFLTSTVPLSTRGIHQKYIPHITEMYNSKWNWNNGRTLIIHDLLGCRDCICVINQ